MVRVNRNKLPKAELERLFKQFGSFLGKLTENNAGLFLQELLGPEERLTLAKRLAIIVMLNEGYSIYRVADTLKISTSTAERINERLDKGVYDHLLEVLAKNKNDYFVLLDVLEAILTVGGIMPSRAGTGRYRNIRR